MLHLYPEGCVYSSDAALVVAEMVGVMFVDLPQIIPTHEPPKFTTTDTIPGPNAEFSVQGSTFVNFFQVQLVAKQHREQDKGALVKTPFLL